MPRVANLPNALTLLRLVLAPALLWLLLWRFDRPALALFAVSALTDYLDGMLARRWNERTRFGAIADPVADKLTVGLVVLTLAAQGSLPIWLAAAAVLRDVVIVGGALAFQGVVGRLDIQPSAVSKLNTAFMFTLLLATLASRSGLLPTGPWLPALQAAALMLVVTSGVDYVWRWGRKARQARRHAGADADSSP